MRYRVLIAVIVLCGAVYGVSLWNTGHVMTDDLPAQLVSPQVHEDGRITFRIQAPRAKQVSVKGLLGQPTQPMHKVDKGVWEVTVGPLDPTLYSYVFEIDGADHVDPHNRDVKKWLSLQSMVEVPGTPPRAYEQTDVPHGAIHKHWYRSSMTNHYRPVVVYTPPSYSTTAETPLPVVFLLHGYGDDESAWTEVGRVHWIADNLIAQGKIDPIVIVMPYGHPVPIDRAVEFDNYTPENLKQMEHDVIDDLSPFVESTYRVADDRMRRAIVGLSMGGGQSLTIGLRHVDRFAHVGGFSSSAPQGDLSQSFPKITSDIERANGQIKLLWIGCGTDDFLLERNRDFIQQLNQHGLHHTYEETDGGHDWIVWRRYLETFLPRCFPASQ